MKLKYYNFCDQVFSNLLQNIYKLLMYVKKRIYIYIYIVFIFIIQGIHISIRINIFYLQSSMYLYKIWIQKILLTSII